MCAVHNNAIVVALTGKPPLPAPLYCKQPPVTLQESVSEEGELTADEAQAATLIQTAARSRAAKRELAEKLAERETAVGQHRAARPRPLLRCGRYMERTCYLVTVRRRPKAADSSERGHSGGYRVEAEPVSGGEATLALDLPASHVRVPGSLQRMVGAQAAREYAEEKTLLDTVRRLVVELDPAGKAHKLALAASVDSAAAANRPEWYDQSTTPHGSTHHVGFRDDVAEGGGGGGGRSNRGGSTPLATGRSDGTNLGPEDEEAYDYFDSDAVSRAVPAGTVVLRAAYRISGKSLLVTVRRAAAATGGYDVTAVSVQQPSMAPLTAVISDPELSAAARDEAAFAACDMTVVSDAARQLVGSQTQLVWSVGKGKGAVEVDVMATAPKPYRTSVQLAGGYYVLSVSASPGGLYLLECVEPMTGWRRTLLLSSLEVGLRAGSEFASAAAGLCSRVSIEGEGDKRAVVVSPVVIPLR